MSARLNATGTRCGAGPKLVILIVKVTSSPKAYSVLSSDTSETRTGGLPRIPEHLPPSIMPGGKGLGWRARSFGCAEKSYTATRCARTDEAVSAKATSTESALNDRDWRY